jgi:hypothetical protein
VSRQVAIREASIIEFFCACVEVSIREVGTVIILASCIPDALVVGESVVQSREAISMLCPSALLPFLLLRIGCQ